MQYAVHGHILEMVGSCPVNYYTTKSQEDLGKNTHGSQKVRRRINFRFSVGGQGIQNRIF